MAYFYRLIICCWLVTLTLFLDGIVVTTFAEQANDRPSAAACPSSMVLVQLSSGQLCFGRFEVTTKEFARCNAAHKCSKRSVKSQCNANLRKVGNHPVNCVTWTQATQFCHWLGGRLPTSEEWEQVALNILPKLVSTDDSNPPADVCWNDRKSSVGTCAVGEFCEPDEVCDMAGNVAEWTSTTVTLPGGAKNVIVKGGGWIFEPQKFAAELDPKFKQYVKPKASFVDLGFRCVIDPAPSK